MRVGKLIGAMCAVCGVLVMALPIPIVVDNFADYYSEQKKLEAKEQRSATNTGSVYSTLFVSYPLLMSSLECGIERKVFLFVFSRRPFCEFYLMLLFLHQFLGRFSTTAYSTTCLKIHFYELFRKSLKKFRQKPKRNLELGILKML